MSMHKATRTYPSMDYYYRDLLPLLCKHGDATQSKHYEKKKLCKIYKCM